jgi:hypothetical protein
MISNPIRFKSRYSLYKDFLNHMNNSGANVWTCEIAFGDRQFEVTRNHPQNLQLRTIDELWHKENALNLMVQRLPLDWKYILWIDTDIMFHRPDWLKEAWHQLQHYEVIQLFSEAYDLDPNFNVFQRHRGFVAAHINGELEKSLDMTFGSYGAITKNGAFAHTGYAWGCTRTFFDAVGGLIDFSILGSADHNMAKSLLGQVEASFPSKMSERYADELLIWEKRAKIFGLKDIGFVSGAISHFWHGKKKDRRYVDRWKILTENHYDPDDDLKRDWQGLLQIEVLNERQIKLRDQVRAYFRARNEDSIDLE